VLLIANTTPSVGALITYCANATVDAFSAACAWLACPLAVSRVSLLMDFGSMP
jgi:hypothetical protein